MTTITEAPAATCPGCGAPANTCGCVAGLDYAEPEPAATPEELFDIGQVTQEWIEEQIERELSLEQELVRLGEQYMFRVARKKAEIAEHQERTRHVVKAWFDVQPKNGKSLHLATGTLSTKLNRGGPKIVDQAEALAWAEANAKNFVKVETVTTKKLDGDLYRKHAAAELKANGEVLPGIEFTQDWESFFVKAPKSTGEEV